MWWRVRKAVAASLLGLLLTFSSTAPVLAATDTSQNPQSGSIGLEGTISTDPPKTAATITTPGNGAVVSTMPITIAGLCPSGTLVKIFSNNVFVGSTTCKSGSYTLQATLFAGANALIARVFDALDQAGPDSNTVNVTYNDAQFAQFGTVVSLTSLYARRGVNPGTSLSWPLILSGGVGPYAVSVDWGDGSAPQLKSLNFAGDFSIDHVYSAAGIYKVTVRVTDKNGTTAFLQLVAVANGASQGGAASGKNTSSVITKVIVLWWPILLVLPLLLTSFWLGRRHQLYVLRRELESAERQ